MSSVLTVENIRKDFGKVTVADDLSFQIAASSYSVVLGPSGTGKTTLLHMVAGLVRPDGGRISLGGIPLDGPGIHVPTELRRLGLVFQDYALWPHLSVFEQVAFSMRLRRATRLEVETKVKYWLGLLRLESLADRYPHEISGGQKQRVGIARALAAEPKLLLMDEPFSNLDAPLREALRGELAGLHAELGITVLHVTHDRQDALSLADRVLVLTEGRLLQEGSPYELYQTPRNPFVASLLGAANLIPGAVEKSADSVAVTGDGLRLVGDVPLPLNGRGVAFFRPEDAQLLFEEPAPTAPNCFPVAVVRSILHDNHWRHRLQTGQQEVWAFGPNPLEPGSRLWVHVPPEVCRILPPEDDAA